LGVGIVEINLLRDNVICSFLPKGSLTLLHVSNRFLNLPLGVFAVAFSTILLPHFSRVNVYAPKRLHFYLLETAKFVTWVIGPTMLFIFFSSNTIFTHLYQMIANKMPPGPSRVPEATAILICYSAGLLFFCFNKVLINMFYARHDTWCPTVASIIATGTNFVFNIIGMYFFGAPGIAASTTISGITLTVTCLYFLYKKHNFRLYWGSYGLFLGHFSFQLFLAINLFLGGHFLVFSLLSYTPWYDIFYVQWGYWLFTIPLFLFTMMFLFLTRRLCKTNVYFLTK